MFRFTLRGNMKAVDCLKATRIRHRPRTSPRYLSVTCYLSKSLWPIIAPWPYARSTELIIIKKSINVLIDSSCR